MATTPSRRTKNRSAAVRGHYTRVFIVDGEPGTGKTGPSVNPEADVIERPNFQADHASFLRCADYH